MDTPDKNYSQTNGINRYYVHCKVDAQVHAIINEIGTRKGMHTSPTATMLLEMGIEYYEKWEKDFVPTKQMIVFKKLREQTEKNEFNGALAVIKQSLAEEEFLEFCQINQINLSEFDELNIPEKKTNKRERIRTFIRILFTDRPEGILATRLFEIAKQEGFGEKMLYEEAKKLGILPIKIGDTFVWKKQENSI